MFHFVLQGLKFLHQNADCKPAQKTKIRKKLLFPDPNDLRKQGISISSTVTPMPRKNGGTFFFFHVVLFFAFISFTKKQQSKTEVFNQFLFNFPHSMLITSFQLCFSKSEIQQKYLGKFSNSMYLNSLWFISLVKPGSHGLQFRFCHNQ